MRDSLKAILGFTIFVCIAGAFVPFIMPELQRSSWKWPIFALAGVTGVIAIAWFFKLEHQKDKAPDYLYQQAGKYFDRDGFCFSLIPKVENGICVIHVLFQNRYDHASQARVALRPARELFMRADIPIIGIDIPCEPGAFGVARVPFPVPVKYQGSNQKFEVGADVQYPQGKGGMLRYRSGMLLRASSQFKNPFGTGLTAAGAAAGAIVISSPASLSFRMPTNVSESVQTSFTKVVTLWRLGDPVLPDSVQV